MPVISGDVANMSTWSDKVVGKFNIVCSWEFLEHVPHEDLSASIHNMISLLAPRGVFVHRIGTTTIEGVRLDNDVTHVSNHTYAWWDDFILSECSQFNLKPHTQLINALNESFINRDWFGRFFAYKV